jgi:hypothetical protein
MVYWHIGDEIDDESLNYPHFCNEALIPLVEFQD